jgi:hypothetical protein
MMFKKNPLLLVSAISIVVVALLSSRIVPIYDGVGFPDEPYRYVKPPASSKATLPADTAAITIRLQDNTNPSDFGLASKEQGPQVNLYIYRLILSTESPGTKAIIRATPKDPANSKTSKGKVVGNIYELSAVSNGGTVSFKPKLNIGFIDLRLPQGETANATMVFRPKPDKKWQILNTSQVGRDVYEASIVGFGDYALVPGSASSGSSAHSPAFIFLILITIIIALAIILAILRARDKKSKKRKASK